MRRWQVAVLVLLLSFPVVFAKGTRETEPMPVHPPLDPQQTFVIGLLAGGDPLFLDPVEATDATSLLVLDGLFEGLFSLDPQTAAPIPAIAREATVSDDGLLWTITLDGDARFSNGDPILASTFLDSWFWLLDRSATGNGNSYLVSMMECIEGVKAYREGNGTKADVGLKATAPLQLEISLRFAAPYLPALLATLPFSAIHQSLRNGKPLEETRSLISSGPYAVNSYSDSSVVLEKHPWYRDYASVPSDYLEFKMLDQRSIITSYLEGNIHWSLVYIPRELLRSRADLHIGPEYSTGFYYFSASSGPYANPQVKKALAKLIPWDELRRTSGQVFPTTRLIPNQANVSQEPDVSLAESEAFDILAEAGFPYGAGLPPLLMAVHRGSQLIGSAQKIADIWSTKLGITVILDVVPLGMYSRFPALSPYDFAFITWIGDIHDPFAFLHLWNGDSDYNLGNLKDGRFDGLVAAAMEAGDDRQRMQLVEEAERYLLESCAVFPIYHGITTNIIDSGTVTGWYDNILNIHPVKYLGIEAK